MSKKTHAAYEHDKLMLALVGECCPSDGVPNSVADMEKEYEEYRESLDEINVMIQYSQDIGDMEEVASWRRFLMRQKMAMRELKSKIMDANNTMVKEIAYS